MPQMSRSEFRAWLKTAPQQPYGYCRDCRVPLKNIAHYSVGPMTMDAVACPSCQREHFEGA
jgi:hypothetical protein